MTTSTERASHAARIKNEKYYQLRLATYLESPTLCLHCSQPILPNPDRRNLAHTKTKKFCNQSCAASYNNQRAPKRAKLPREKTPRKGSQIGFKTKGELFAQRSNWQSARSGIRNHAGLQYQGTYECDICGYPRYTEVCHIRAVADFPDTATLNEINHPDNLTRLCPNHHWELDHPE